MIPVKQQPKFKCDFCKKRSTRAVMETHERRCFRNPNRFCEACQNTKNYSGTPGDCPYCSKFDKKLLADIEAAEARV